MSPVVALLLSPIATELPEILNAIIWVRAGKTQLAPANISGGMMIQATVPSGIGILFTPWKFDAPLLPAASSQHQPGSHGPQPLAKHTERPGR
jgi:cation:H+ antiporter